LNKNNSDILESIQTDYRYKVFNKCPICLSSSIIKKGRKGTGDIKTHPQAYRCNKCCIYFVNPIMDKESLYKLYENFNIKYGKLPTTALKKMERNVSYWNTYFKDKKTIQGELRCLDIGSASGDLVKVFSEYGWDAHGIEPCKELVNYSIKELGVNNIKHSAVEETDYPENYFDFIHFWHVLEHLTDPMKALKKIYRWLKPGGILNLGTPSPSSLYATIYPLFTGYFSLGTEHTFIFPQKSLKSILESIGFKIEKHRVYSTLKSGSNVKIKIHNFLHHIFPRAVANFQLAVVEKPADNY